MCGIFGFAGLGLKRSSSVELDHFFAATSLAEHRGPDDGGFFWDGKVFFGHRRLSIIDLDPRSRQPMVSDSLVITFNGEIYNYIELRKELEALGAQFRTKSDTEVLLHAYRFWGRNFLSRLEGMFAFGIYDRLREELLLGRDRFGEKPLFYAQTPEGFFFSSEVKAISSLPVVSKEISLSGLNEYLRRGFVSGGDTLLQAVKKVKPGHSLLLSKGSLNEQAYWTPTGGVTREGLAAKKELNEVEWVDLIEEKFRRSVELVCRADVPITIFLSGGIDSALTGVFASEMGHIQEAYCLDFDEASYSEFGRAQTTAAKANLRLNRVRISERILEDLPQIVRHGDDPIADSSQLCVWQISKEVAKRYKVVLSGDGGDEVFGGYLTYRATMLHQKFVQPLPSPIKAALKWLSRHVPVSGEKVSTSLKLKRFLRAAGSPAFEAHESWNGLWSPEEVKRILGGSHSRPDQSQVSLQDLQLHDFRSYLPDDILTKVDRMTMAHGLESRTPFLNSKLVEQALELPEALRIRGGESKRALRLLADRKIGPEISRAPKQGFSVPIHQWLRQGPGKDLILGHLNKTGLARFPFRDIENLLSERDDFLSGRSQLGFEMFGLLSLALWDSHLQQAQVTIGSKSSPLRNVEISN